MFSSLERLRTHVNIFGYRALSRRIMANHSRSIVLTETDRVELQGLLRSPSVASGLSRRARVVLLLADNISGTETALLTGYTSVQVSRIRRRFAEEGLSGLSEK